MTKTKKIIWDNDVYSLYRSMIDEEGYEENDQTYEVAADTIEEYFDCERINLDKELEADIICIGDLGFWFGRRHGYKMLGTNLNSVLIPGISEIYVDEKNDIRATHPDHDGTSFYLFRMYKEGLGEDEKEDFEELIYNGRETDEDINKYTLPLGPYVAEIYGWTNNNEEEN